MAILIVRHSEAAAPRVRSRRVISCRLHVDSGYFTSNHSHRHSIDRHVDHDDHASRAESRSANRKWLGEREAARWTYFCGVFCQEYGQTQR